MRRARVLLCPRCTKPLSRVRDGHGDGAACSTCGGRAVAFVALRTGLPVEVARALAHAIRGGPRHGTLPCPSCSEDMVDVDAGGDGPPVVVAGCPGCAYAWFDPDGVRRLAPPPKQRRVRPSSAEEVVAAYELARGQDAVARSGVEFGSAEGIAGYLGLPTLQGVPRSDTRPWSTRLLAAALVATSAAVLIAGLADGLSGVGDHARAVIAAGGFVPADPWRHGGATWISSGFLHGGPWHLFANVYMLLLAGSVVERNLGHARLLGLYFVSALAGNLLEVATDGASYVPRIGASGAIAGLLAYLAFAMPRVQVCLYFGDWRTANRLTFTRLEVPGPWVLGVWSAAQLVGLLGRDARVAFASHVGGALGGVGWWAVARWRASRAATVPPVLPPAAVPADPPATTRAPPESPAPLPEPPRAVEAAPVPVSATGFVLEEEPPPAPSPRHVERPAVSAPAEAGSEALPGGDARTGADEGDFSPPGTDVEAAPRPRDDEWTIREGVQDAARGLLRRAAWAAPLWAAVCAVLAGLARATAFMGLLTGLTFVLAVVSLLSGVLVGHLMGRDLVDEVRFSGWIPAALAATASVLLVVIVEFLVGRVVPFENGIYGAIVGLGGTTGAIGGALKATWAAE